MMRRWSRRNSLADVRYGVHPAANTNFVADIWGIAELVHQGNVVGVRPPEELMLQHDRVNLEQRCEARVKFCCTSQRRKKELALNCRRDRIREKDGSQQTVHRMLERERCHRLRAITEGWLDAACLPGALAACRWCGSSQQVSWGSDPGPVPCPASCTEQNQIYSQWGRSRPAAASALDTWWLEEATRRSHKNCPCLIVIGRWVQAPPWGRRRRHDSVGQLTWSTAPAYPAHPN